MRYLLSHVEPVGRKGYNFVENHVCCSVDKYGDNSCSTRMFSSKHNTADLMCNQAGCIHKTSVSETYEATTSTVIGNDTSG